MCLSVCLCALDVVFVFLFQSRALQTLLMSVLYVLSVRSTSGTQSIDSQTRTTATHTTKLRHSSHTSAPARTRPGNATHYVQMPGYIMKIVGNCRISGMECQVKRLWKHATSGTQSNDSQTPRSCETRKCDTLCASARFIMKNVRNCRSSGMACPVKRSAWVFEFCQNQIYGPARPRKLFDLAPQCF